MYCALAVLFVFFSLRATDTVRVGHKAHHSVFYEANYMCLLMCALWPVYESQHGTTCHTRITVNEAAQKSTRGEKQWPD